MILETMTFQNDRREIDTSSIVKLITRSALGLGVSFCLFTVNTNKINAFNSVPVHSHRAEASTIVPATKACSNCGQQKRLVEFHRKGDRTDARCRSCISEIGKERRLEKKKLSLKKPRGRVLDLSMFTATVASTQNSSPVETSLSEWVEFTLGG